MSFQNYFDNIPEIVISILNGLQNEFRLYLLEELKNKESMSLSEIQKITGKESGYLIKNIHNLELSGLVSNYIKKIPDRRDYSFYEVTDFGRTFLENILSFIKKKRKNTKLKQPKQSKQYVSFFKAISNRFRFAILVFLKESKEFSFSSLKNITKKNESSLSNHLHKLEQNLMIQNFYRKKNESRDYSYYRITKFGKEALDVIINSYNLYFQSKINPVSSPSSSKPTLTI